MFGIDFKNIFNHKAPLSIFPASIFELWEGSNYRYKYPCIFFIFFLKIIDTMIIKI